jgi:hypothetical protein
MGCYGTSGSQVFLGWNNQVPPPPYPEQRGGSPQYEYAIVNSYNYAFVAGAFWYYMSLGYNVVGALNSISSLIYTCNFSQSPLYGWLVVWGNQNLYLP